MRLSAPGALAPDAQFIRDLEMAFEEFRVFRKDSEAMKLTVQTCCDAAQLAPMAPPFLAKLRTVTSQTKAEERRSALQTFGAAVAATRNEVAHAKANYAPTGEECPTDQLAQFVHCVKLAAQQCIRWFSAQHERVRVR
jgi:hypothetical protein